MSEPNFSFSLLPRTAYEHEDANVNPGVEQPVFAPNITLESLQQFLQDVTGQTFEQTFEQTFDRTSVPSSEQTADAQTSSQASTDVPTSTPILSTNCTLFSNMKDLLPPSGVTSEDVDAAYHKYNSLYKTYHDQKNKSMSMLTEFDNYVVKKVKESPQVKLETEKLKYMKRSLIEILRNTTTSYDQKLTEISSYLLTGPLQNVTNESSHNESFEKLLVDIVTKGMDQCISEYMDDLKEGDFKEIGVSKETYMNYMMKNRSTLTLSAIMTLKHVLRLPEKRAKVTQFTNTVMEIVGRNKTKSDTKVFALTKFFLDTESSQKKSIHKKLSSGLNDYYGLFPYISAETPMYYDTNSRMDIGSLLRAYGY
jgi:hypothetical protein